MSKKINKFTDSDIDIMIDLYVNQNKSLSFIAKQFNCSRPTVSNKLKSNNIELRKVKKKEFSDEDINDIVNKHLTDKINVTAIAKSYNCTHKTIQSLLKKNGVEPKVYRNMKANITKLDEMEIAHKYNLGVSMKYLATEYKTSKSNISKILKSNNVFIENDKEIKFNDKDVKDIINKYENESCSLTNIAKDYNCSANMISSLLKRKNVKIKNFNSQESGINYYELENIKCNSIYMYRNIINDKIYIGMTNNVNDRHNAHMRKMKTGKESIYQAFRKYGIDNFEHKVLESGLSREEANKKEIYYIEKYNSYYDGYNQTHGGDNYNYITVTKEMQDEIIKLYTVDKLSMHNISNKLKYSYRIVSETLNTYAKEEVKNRRPHISAVKEMSDDKINNIKNQFVNEFYKRDIDIANDFNINTNTLNHIIDKDIRLKRRNIKNKVKSIKIDKAIELATETDLNIKDISEIVCLDRHTVSKEIKKNL